MNGTQGGSSGIEYYEYKNNQLINVVKKMIHGYLSMDGQVYEYYIDGIKVSFDEYTQKTSRFSYPTDENFILK